MLNLLHTRGVNAYLIMALALPAPGADPMSAATDDPRAERHPAVLVHGEDVLARMRFEYLTARSSTMRDIVHILSATPRVTTHVHSNFTLRGASSRFGQARILVTDTGVLVFVEFDSGRSSPLQQLLALAHELAHAVEIACLSHLSRGASAAQLFNALAARVSGPMLETRFAVEVGEIVLLEAQMSWSGPSRLPDLARQHGLGPSCSN